MIVLYVLPWYVHGMTGDKAVISVTDFRGKTMSVKKPVNRIVCLIESALSGLYMLDVADKVVGISANIYSGNVFPYYAELDERIRTRRLPTPGNWDFVNIESVISLKPDLVIIWAHQAESIRALEEQSVPVFGVFIEKKEDVYTEIAALGKLTGREKRAEQLPGVHARHERPRGGAAVGQGRPPQGAGVSRFRAALPAGSQPRDRGDHRCGGAGTPATR